MIYRVENSEGIGPYWAEDEYGELIIDFYSPLRKGGGLHPAPCDIWNEDELDLLNSDDNLIFGFTSMEALNKWFNDPDLAVVWDYCSVVKYDCEPVLVHETQCVFRRD